MRETKKINRYTNIKAQIGVGVWGYGRWGELGIKVHGASVNCCDSSGKQYRGHSKTQQPKDPAISHTLGMLL